MIDQDIYIKTNAPTVAENAIKDALWFGKPLSQSIDFFVSHSAKYGIPSERFRDAIMEHINSALSSPEGFVSFIKQERLWRIPGRCTVNTYIRRELETELTPSQIIARVREVGA